jgi:hypothetical protein
MIQKYHILVTYTARLTVRTAILGPDPFPPTGGLLETPQQTPKTDKATVVNLFLPGRVPRTVEQTVT